MAATSGVSKTVQNNSVAVIAASASASQPITNNLFANSVNKTRNETAWDFRMLDNFPSQKSNIAAIPIASQENLLLNDLLYSLIGLRGCYITPQDARGENEAMHGYCVKFKICDQIHSSLRDIAYDILPMASHYTCINKFRQKASASECGQVLQAFAEALKNLEQDYNVG